MRCYWEYLQKWIWEHVGNLRILWEHDENTLKTRQKNKKYPLPTPFPQKRKKLDQISLSKTVHDHFSPGLIPLPKSWGTYREKGI
jgi:hypothetical protein